MQIKTFRALDMREALRMIKAELGPDAVILSSQEVKKGSGAFGLFSRTMVEVTAAVDRHPEGARAPAGERSPEVGAWNDGVSEHRSAILSHGRLPDAQRGLPDSRQDEPRPGTFFPRERNRHFSTSPVKAVSSFSDHMQDATEMQSLRGELVQMKQELSALHDVTAPMAAARSAWRGLEQDVRSVQQLIGSLMRNERDFFVQRLPPSIRAVYDWMVDAGIELEVVFDLVKQLQSSPPSSDEHLAATVRQILSQQVVQSVQCAGPMLEEPSGPHGLAKVVMIVGPTGVGKTTTIAKLAAQYALQRKRKVALITLDTYRVAAVEQLRVYGNILGLAVEVALTCEDLAGILRARKTADLILIDTAGRSPLDQAAFRELKKLVVLNRQVEAHLVLSAATRESDLALVLPRFATLPVKSLIFSKLDETTQYGTLFTVLHRTRLPVSYLSSGQRVPEDLTLATPKLIADLLLDGFPAITSMDPEAPPPTKAPASNQRAQQPVPRLNPPVPAPAARAEQSTNKPWPTAPQPAVESKTLMGALGRALTLRAAKK